MTQPMTMRLEFFVTDVSQSADFYERVLNFTRGEQRADGYIPLTNGSVHIALNRLADLPDDHPIAVAAGERAGRGLEIVLEVDDVQAIYDYVAAQNTGQPIELMTQPWGLTDFRVVDPDGYYWRITSRA